MVVVGVAGGATGGDSDGGVAEAVHNGEASDIMDEKDSKRGLWKSVKDLRRMLRLAQSYFTLLCSHQFHSHRDTYRADPKAPHSRDWPSLSRTCPAFCERENFASFTTLSYHPSLRTLSLTHYKFGVRSGLHFLISTT